MSVRIFSKKAFQFGTGANRLTGEIDCFVTVPGTFQSMPEKFLDDKTFKLAIKTGSVSIINNNIEQNKAEDSVVAQADDYDTTKAYYEKLKTMNREFAIEEGKKYNVEIEGDEKLGVFKKRVFEAYKLSLEE